MQLTLQDRFSVAAPDEGALNAGTATEDRSYGLIFNSVHSSIGFVVCAVGADQVRCIQ